MKIIFVLFVCGSLGGFWLARQEYVCLPCGRECDSKAYDRSGQCVGCGMKLVQKSTIAFKNVSVDEFCQRITSNSDALVLDVRSSDEFKGTSKEVNTFGHFKTAININVNELESRVSEIEKYKSKEVLVYCSHAHRSAVASYFLSTHGFQNVKNMLGGVSTVSDSPCLTKSFARHAY